MSLASLDLRINQYVRKCSTRNERARPRHWSHWYAVPKTKSKNRSPPLTQLPCEVKFYSIMHFNTIRPVKKLINSLSKELVSQSK